MSGALVDLLHTAVTAICAANVRREGLSAAARASALFSSPPLPVFPCLSAGMLSSDLILRRECVHPEED